MSPPAGFPVGLALIVPAFAALLLVGLAALQRPVLARMALRNLRRRRAQALAIGLGLVVGTAIIAGSLAIGDSSSAALRDLAIGSFGPVDETVGLDGSLAFPQAAAEQLAQDPGVRAASDAVEPALLTDAAVANPRAGQFEPRATLIGLDPAQDRAMGPFRTAWGAAPGTAPGWGTLDALGADGIVLNEQLAAKVHARPGDTVTVRYAQRPEPWVPKVATFNGTLGAGAGAPLPIVPLPGPFPHPPPPYSPSTPVDNATFNFTVDAGARRVTAALFWSSLNNRTDMDLALDAPDGTEWWNANGTYGQPDTPAILNATAQPGPWKARVVSKVAVEQRFTLVVLVFYEVHDLATIQQFVDQVHSDPRAASFVENLTGPLRVEQRDFTVRFVASQEGRGGFLQQPDAWVRLDVLQGMLAKQGRVNLVFVSNPGDAQQGLQGTDAAMAALRAGIASLPDPDHALDGLAPRAVKQEFLGDAERASTLFTSFLGMMGSFSVLAGLILIVNTFVQLAEERRTELGVARALGLRQREVVQLFLFEGGLYALAAPALGVLLGLGVAALLIAAFTQVGGGQGTTAIGLLRLSFAPTAGSALTALAAGVLMTLAAVGLAAQRASRLNIVRSIRQLEEPDQPAGRGTDLAALAMLLAGLPLTAWAVDGGPFVALVHGPNLLILGGGLLLARVVPRSAAVRATALAVVAWNLATNVLFDFPVSLEGMVVGAVRGVLIVLGAVLLLVQSRALPRVGAAVVQRVRSVRPIARTSMAYPLHRKLRTGLTVVMFALVLTTVVMFSIIFAVLTPDPGDQGGGFDVRAETTVPVPDFAERLHAAQAREPALGSVRSVTDLDFAQVFGGRLITVNGSPVRYHGLPLDNIYGFDEGFVREQDFPLVELDARFATARDAYEAVLRDPTLVVVSSTYSNGPDALPGVHHVGDVLRMRTRAGPVNLTIVAIQKQVYYGGLFVGKPVVQANFDDLHGVHLLKLAPGSDAQAVSDAIERSQQDAGTDAESVAVASLAPVQQQQRLSRLFEVYLGFGLILGVASLGIVTARSVFERRQEVGMLRAIGLSKQLVFRSFLVEGLFIFTLGALVGVSVGFAVAWGAHLKSLASLGVPFRVPWLDIAGILLVAYLATIAATLAPARRAARLAPAEAIRYIE